MSGERALEMLKTLLLDDLGRKAVAAKADLGHHPWLRLKSLDGGSTPDVTRSLPSLLQKRNRASRSEYASIKNGDP